MQYAEQLEVDTLLIIQIDSTWFSVRLFVRLSNWGLPLYVYLMGNLYIAVCEAFSWNYIHMAWLKENPIKHRPSHLHYHPQYQNTKKNLIFSILLHTLVYFSVLLTYRGIHGKYFLTVAWSDVWYFIIEMECPLSSPLHVNIQTWFWWCLPIPQVFICVALKIIHFTISFVFESIEDTR